MQKKQEEDQFGELSSERVVYSINKAHRLNSETGNTSKQKTNQVHVVADEHTDDQFPSPTGTIE